jgi:hypothetical protein
MPKKKRKIVESPLQDAPWPFSPERDLAHILATLETQFRSDTSNPLPAFDALCHFAAYVWKHEEAPRHSILIPWWIVQTLAIGFSEYRDSADSTTPMTLGEAYNLEGRGQGKEPRVQRESRDLRNIRIVAAIALAAADGIKIEAALQEQADKTGLSASQVRRIWEANRRHAKSCVRNFKMRA